MPHAPDLSHFSNSQIIQHNIMREIIDLNTVLTSHHTVLLIFGKGSSEYSSVIHGALNYLKELTENLFIIDISRNKLLRQQAQKYSSWDFFPQLYVGGEFIGGAFIFPEFFASGEYHKILTSKFPDIVINNDNFCPDTIRAKNKTSAIWRFHYQPHIKKLLGASASGCIVLCNSENNTIQNSYQIHPGWVNVAKFFDSGRKILAGLTDATIRILDTSSYETIGILSEHHRWVNDIYVCEEVHRAWSISADNYLIEWDLKQRKSVKKVIVSNSCLWAISLTGNQDCLVVGDAEGKAIFIDKSNLEEVRIIKPHESCITSIIPDTITGGVISSSYDGTVRFLDVNGDQLRLLETHLERVWSVDLCPSTSLLVSASGDGTVKVCRYNNLEEIVQWSFESMPISVCWINGLGGLAIGHSNGKITWKNVFL